uniref:Vigilin n=1 Tax=Scleropages formosus TaxID=113540 RepID=A0A8C9VF01_SCLFO
MSSVAVLTQESFNEHRNGLLPEQISSVGSSGNDDDDVLPTYKEAFPPLPEKAATPEGRQELDNAWTKIRPLKSSIITQVFHVPLEERKYKDINQFGEGDQAKICVDIMQKTGAHLELSMAKDQGLSIMVSGKLDAVMKARKEIVSRLQTQASATVAIPKEHHRFVIGKNGEKLQELELKTATKIQIPRPEDPSNHIKISGTKEGLEKAKHEILLISAEQDKRAVERVNIDKVYHPFITGAYNKFVAEMMQETGARINVPPPSVLKTEIVITGEKEQVAQAVAMIKKIYEEKRFDICEPLFLVQKKNATTIAVEVKKSQHKYVIGPRGNTLQEILEKTGVSVEIPPPDSSSETVILRGEPDRLGQALTEYLNLRLLFSQENERTKDMIIEQRFHRAIIGQKGEKIKEVRDKFPEVIINFPDPAQKSDIVQLRGPRTEVEKCSKFMQKMVAEMVENSYSVSVPIFKQFHKNIIGKGGANIKKIREETNTKIDLPAENSNSEMIVITGKKANCEAARNRILAIQKELANITEIEVSIPSKLHNSLIGSKGRFVRSIMEECGGVHIHFPTEGSGIDTVTIRGPVEDVEKAKRQLLSVAEEKQTKSHTAELRAKPEYHKFLIGKGGGNIKKVRDSTGARIIFPTADDKDQELITVVGTEEAVREAQKELETLIKSLDNVVEDGMTVDPKHHRYFVARRGQVLRDIADEYGGVMVSFPRTGSQSDKVTLKGAKDCVEAAKKRMLEIIEDLEAQVTMECVIAQKFHRSIMGPKGLRIQQITREHNVQIKFPEREDVQASTAETTAQENGETNGEVKDAADPATPRKCDVIVLSGRKERCEAAVEALKALVPVTIEVEVPFELHRYIIGQKGSGIRKMMDEYEVNIQVPAPELHSDIIAITGLACHLDRAKEGLLERVKELQAEQEDRALRSFKLTITVDPKYHPKIIGRKGAIITQIRNEHDVNIQFPEKNDENQDQITITGYEQKAIAARNAIQAIVDDLEEMISEDITLDSRVHARIIGARGKGIRKIMDEFKVDLKFPQNGAADPNLVTVMGRPEDVDEAIDHLLNLEEEYLADVVENESKQAYMKPRATASSVSAGEEQRSSSKGFVVREAPWTTSTEKAPDMSSSEDFPSFGASVTPKTSPWGPKRF